MNNEKQINLYIVSDSVGGTASALGRATSAQFPDIKLHLSAHPFVRDKEKLLQILRKAAEADAIVVHTLVTPELQILTQDFCREHGIFCLDPLNGIIQEIEKRTSLPHLQKPGAQHKLDRKYFDRIDAIEFAVKYDDGRDPKGFLEADILILGVSRTSKTPLSMFLANQNYKVANLPIVPEAHIPEQLWKIDPKKIVGLTNDVDVINDIRRERMVQYGMNPDTAYSNIDRIEEELAFANDLYEKLGCLVINVSKKSIEETAAIIVNTLKPPKNKNSKQI